MDSWEQKKEEVLTELAIMAIEMREQEFEFLVAAVTKIACALCTDNPQFVLMRLLKIGNGSDKDAYQIMFGMPPDSTRHGLNEIGKLFEPREKVALTRAKGNKEIVVVNNVAENPLTNYMREHAANKGINHLVVIPIPILVAGDQEEEVQWLIVIDRVGCAKEFDDDEREFLFRCAKIISTAFSVQRRDQKRYRKTISGKKRDLISSLEDLIRNPLSIVGLASQRTKKSLDKGEYLEAMTYSQMAYQNSQRIIRDLELLDDYGNYLKDDLNITATRKKVLDYLEVFRGEEYTIETNLYDDQVKISCSEKLFLALLERIKSYMLVNQKSNAIRVAVKAEQGLETVTFQFFSSGFKHFKLGIDLNLQLILDLAEVLEGRAEVHDGVLVLTFPLA